MKLHEERNLVKARAKAAVEYIRSQRAYLMGSKFAGDAPFDNYVSVHEPLAMLDFVQRVLDGNFDDDPDIIPPEPNPQPPTPLQQEEL